MNGGEAAPNESTFQWNALQYRYHGETPSESREGTVPLPRGVRGIVGKDMGRRYLFRPGELMVHQVDLETYPDLARAIEDRGGERWAASDFETYGWGGTAKKDGRRIDPVVTAKIEDRKKLAGMALEKAGVVRYVVRPLLAPRAQPDLPRFIDELRRQGFQHGTGEWPVHPHIVLAGESGSYGPAGPPNRANERVPEPAGDLGEGIRVGVVDTGTWKEHKLLKGHCETRGRVDDEVLDEDGNSVLDYEAGHGTFIAGVIRQFAPAAEIVCRGTLDSMGVIDDATLAGTLYSLLGERIDVLNLSIAGYTYASEPTGLPTTIAALRALREENPMLVVVAAAGNDNRPEPKYPAAWSDVVGVGALDGNFSKALFSNYGGWVSVWAPGVRLLSSFVGRQLDQPGGGSTDAWARWSGTSFATPVVAGKIAGAMKRPR